MEEFMELLSPGFTDRLPEICDRETLDEDDASPDAFYSAKQLAESFDVSYETLKKRLKSYRKENLDGSWSEVADRKIRTERFLYKLSGVKPIIEEVTRKEKDKYFRSLGMKRKVSQTQSKQRNSP